MEEACGALKLTAQDMLGFGVIEGILPEGEDFVKAPAAIKASFAAALKEFRSMGQEQIISQRYARFRRLGGPFA